MAKQIWKSKDNQAISRLAEKLEPAKDDDEEETDDPAQARTRTAQSKGGIQLETIEVRYMNSPPPKDLLNYKNMDLEMSLWAKTQAGWLSVAVLLVMATVCFILTWILWGLHGY
jgi:hypothetical protein